MKKIDDKVEKLIYIISCALNKSIPDLSKVHSSQYTDRVDVIEWDHEIADVYSFAKRHMLSAMVGMALKSAGILNKEVDKEVGKAVRKAVLFDNETKIIEKEFERKSIWYIPLKGAILKSYYPSVGMRQFADYDILFDKTRSEDVRQIMEEHGFFTKSFGIGVNDVYYKEPIFNYEMHRRLFDETHDEKLKRYYDNIEEKIVRDDNGYACHFSPNDFYIYIIAHESKHYNDGGIGIRAIVDVYLCNKFLKLNYDYVERECEKLGIAELERTGRELAVGIFSNPENDIQSRINRLSDKAKDMLFYMANSGTYGNVENSVRNNIKKNSGGKTAYALRRFLVPFSRKNRLYHIYEVRYPLFYRYKIILPFLPFYRLFGAIRRGTFKRELRAIRKN